jgi:hypothetical protein
MRGEGINITKYPATLTTYVKGENVRTEVAGGEVRIYKGETKQTYILDPEKKTYYLQRTFTPRGGAPGGQDGQGGPGGQDNANAAGGGQGGPGGPGGPGGRFGMQMDSHLSTVKATGDSITQSISGTSATKYDISGTVNIKLPTFGGRRRQQSDDDANATPPAPRTITVKVSGEIWFADDVKLPDDKEIQSRVLSSVLASAPQLVQPLQEEIVKVGLLPLASKLVVETSISGSDQPQKATVSYKLTSLTNTDVDDSLFQAPDDYTKVQAPSFGGRGGRRGQDGGQGGGGGQGGATDQGAQAGGDAGGPGGPPPDGGGMTPPPDGN